MKIRSALSGLLLPMTVSTAVAGGELSVSGAWIRAAPPNAPVLAGYMTVENRSHAANSFVDAASPAFEGYSFTAVRTGTVWRI